MKNFHPDNNCPVRNVLCRLGDKWSMLVLITLNANGTMRFCDIHKTIADISQRMLTVTLRTLETDGLVSRKVYAEVPPRVEYELTERGKKLNTTYRRISRLGFTTDAGNYGKQEPNRHSLKKN